MSVLNTKSSRAARSRPLPSPAQVCRSRAPAPRLADAIEHLPVAELKPYRRNPRDHSDRQIAKLAGTIRAVGFLVPIIVDKTSCIVAGHGRWAAARQLGLVKVPVIRAAHLTSEQVKAFRLADNRLGELSSWDETALALEFKDLAAVELDPEILELTGFETSEVDLRIASLDEDAPDEADRVPEPEPGPAISRPGDLWMLGPHRLLCASSLEEASYERLLDGAKVRMVFSDPPYNVPILGHVRGPGRMQHREFAMASGEMSEDAFIAFLSGYLALARRHSMQGALHYVCMDGAHAYEVMSAARATGLSFKTTCTWAKTNAGMGSLYRQQTEFVHVFKNGGDDIAHVNNIQLGRYGRFRTTLWTYPGVNSFGLGRVEDLAAHPTVKPWALVADAIKDCTKPNEAVLDCFCGSGTTLIAAHKARRIGYGIELDARYVDVAVRRWQDLTGEDAVCASSGRTFREIAAERQAEPMSVPAADRGASIASEPAEASHD